MLNCYRIVIVRFSEQVKGCVVEAPINCCVTKYPLSGMVKMLEIRGHYQLYSVRILLKLNSRAS